MIPTTHLELVHQGDNFIFKTLVRHIVSSQVNFVADKDDRNLCVAVEILDWVSNVHRRGMKVQKADVSMLSLVSYIHAQRSDIRQPMSSKSAERCRFVDGVHDADHMRLPDL